MAKVSLMTLDKAPACDPPEGSEGAIRSQAFFARAGDPIHVHLHRLDEGARLRIGASPGDRLAYVWRGMVDAAGVELKSGAAALLDGGTSLDMTAVGSDASLLIYEAVQRHRGVGPYSGIVRLLPHDRVPRIDRTAGFNIGSALFADSRSPGVRVWMHETEIRDADDPVALHSHSEDEVIFVTAGHIRLGNRLFEPGTAFAIAAHTRYQFSSGPDGLTFINFRNTSPTYASADGSLVLDEADFFIGHVGRPKYIRAVTATKQ